MGVWLQGMICPRCHRMAQEVVNDSVGVKGVDCRCGYVYVDDIHGAFDGTEHEVTQEMIDEFYGAIRVPEEQQKEWWGHIVRQRHDLAKFRDLVGEEKYRDIMQDCLSVEEMEAQWEKRNERKPKEFVLEMAIRAIEYVLIYAKQRMPGHYPIQTFGKEVLESILSTMGETKSFPTAEIEAANRDMFKRLSEFASMFYKQALKRGSVPGPDDMNDLELTGPEPATISAVDDIIATAIMDVDENDDEDLLDDDFIANLRAL